MSKSPVISQLLGIAIEPTYFDLKRHDVNPSEIVNIAKNTGANTLRVGMFSHQGHTYYPSQIAPPAPFLRGRNLLKEFEREAGKAGIRLVVYLNSKWVRDLFKQHPDWVVRIKGRPRTFKDVDRQTALVIYPMCPCSPFLEYFIGIVKEVCAMSQPSGIYIDNFEIVPFCECPYCRKRYGRRIPANGDGHGSETRKYLQWVVRESRSIARRIVSAARGRNPQMPVIFNRGQFWSPYATFSPEDNAVYAHKIAGGVHAESAVRFYNESFEHINEQCAFGRAINLPIWTWVEYAMYPFSYVGPTPAEAKVKAAKVIANGGRPMVWNMPCAPSVNRKGLAGISAVFNMVSRDKALFNDVAFEKFAGLVFSSRSVRVYCQGGKERLAEYKKTFAGAHSLLIRNHLPYDFVLDGQVAIENLKNYKVIVLPNTVHLDALQCQALERYVSRGGAVFATYETSLYDSGGKRRKNFGLHALFGADYVRDLGAQFAGDCAGYSRFIGDHPTNKGELKDNYFPVGGNYLAVKSKNAIARLLERCRYYCDYPQPETEHPAIIAGRYGKGKVVYIPGEFFSFYYAKGLLEHSRFFAQCMEWFVGGEPPIITDLPDTVEVTLTHNGEGARIIHLVNCAFDKTRPIPEVVPVSGCYLKIKAKGRYRRALDLSTGKKVSFTMEKERLHMKLPVLTGYNVIVLD